MAEQVAKGAEPAASEVSDAYAAARELLRRAADDADGIRAEADLYSRRREQEVELLVAKARRLLEVAEEKAAAMAAGGPAPPALDLDALVAEEDERAPAVPTALDQLLRSAIGRAVDKSFAVGS